MNAPYLSVVIPAYNEERRLPFSLQRIHDYLERKAESYEVVIVDDGSTDNTVDCVRALGDSRVALVHNEANRGKGYSVRRGMLTARGAYRLMCDADLSTPIEEAERLLAAVKAGADVAIGSRAARGARIEQHQPWYRENVGRLFNLAVRMIAVSGISDTQCGFKLFSGRVAEEATVSRRSPSSGATMWPRASRHSKALAPSSICCASVSARTSDATGQAGPAPPGSRCSRSRAAGASTPPLARRAPAA